MSSYVAKGAIDAAILISARAEWLAALDFYNNPAVSETPFGASFQINIAGKDVLFLQGGWGKVSAAASTQYCIDTWHPQVLINLGTCGGFAGRVKQGEILLVNETLIYDIVERMGNPQEALQHYSMHIDLSRLRPPYPQPVRVARLLSADRDIDPVEIPALVTQYDAIAADWESGAITWTAQRNNTRLLILRGVSDLVSTAGGEIYNSPAFQQRANEIMTSLLQHLPGWIACVGEKNLRRVSPESLVFIPILSVLLRLS